MEKKIKKSFVAFVVSILMMSTDTDDSSLDLKGSNSNEPGEKPTNPKGQTPQKLAQRNGKRYTRGTKNSHMLFMVSNPSGEHPDIFYNKVDEVEKSKLDKGWKQIFVNITLFVMASATFHPKVYINWPGGGPQYKDALDAAHAQSIHDGMAASAWFASITGLPAKLTAYQTAIDDWLVLIAKIPIGTKQDKTDLETYSENFRSVTTARLVEIVQGVADSNQINALSIAESAAMQLKGAGGPSEQQWSVTRVSEGSVELVGHVKPYRSVRYTIQWQMTTDTQTQGSWYLEANEIPPTPNGKTRVSNLTVGTKYYFRYRVIITDGTVSDWSNTISITIS